MPNLPWELAELKVSECWSQSPHGLLADGVDPFSMLLQVWKYERCESPKWKEVARETNWFHQVHLRTWLSLLMMVWTVSLQLFPALPPIMCFAQNCSLIDCMEYCLSLIEGVTLSALWPRSVSCILTLLGVDETDIQSWVILCITKHRWNI